MKRILTNSLRLNLFASLFLLFEKRMFLTDVLS
ncbi:hypothetical protein LEP1GSC115_2897, partial [Leptospira interrogans serovar Australis str. 200703203]